MELTAEELEHFLSHNESYNFNKIEQRPTNNWVQHKYIDYCKYVLILQDKKSKKYYALNYYYSPLFHIICHKLTIPLREVIRVIKYEYRVV